MTEKEWYEVFAEWVYGELRRLDWKPADLARRMDVDSGELSNWLRGHRRPGPENCAKFANALGVPLDHVLHLVGHRPLAESDPPPDEIWRLISMLRRIKPYPERLAGIEGSLRMYLERDREQEAEAGAAPEDDGRATERRRLSANFGNFLHEIGDPDAEAHQAVFDDYLKGSQ